MHPNSIMRHTCGLATSLTLAFLCSSATAQSATKILRFDTGGLWNSAVALDSSGDLTIYGNYALGGGSDTLQTGVQDAAVLVASQLGDPEKLVTLAATGAATIEWSDTSESYVTIPWGDPALAGAIEICTHELNGMHAVVTLGADQRTVRIYRHHTGAILLSQFVSTVDLTDIEVFIGAAGLPHVAAVSANSVTCYNLSGLPMWSWPCAAIDLTVLSNPGTGADRFTILEQFGNYTLLNTCSELGILTTSDVSAALPVGQFHETLLFDEDDDGYVDLLIKSEQGVQVLVNTQAATPFDATSTQNFYFPLPAGYAGSADIANGVGETQRLLVGGDGVAIPQWVAISATASLVGPEFLLGSSVVDPEIGSGTRLQFTVEVLDSLVASYVQPGTTTAFEIHAWREAAPNAGVDRLPAESVMLTLMQPPTAGDGMEFSEWSIDLTLPTDLEESASSVATAAWSSDEHYHVTMRIVTISSADRVQEASESITLGITAAASQQSIYTPFSYFDSLALPNTSELTFDIASDNFVVVGGGVVGVITQLPPPPASGASRPTETTGGGESQQEGT